MTDIKLKVAFPARVARKENTYVLYNTRKFVGIYADEKAYKVWQYLNKSKEVYQKELVEYVTNNIVGENEEDQLLINDCLDFVNFLSENGFITISKE